MGSLRFATTGFGPAAAAGCGAGAAVCAAGVAGSREEAAGRGWAGAGTCCHGATVCRAGAESLATCEKKYVRPPLGGRDRKSTRLNSSHQIISYAVFCLKKKTRSSLAVGPRHGHVQ